jgi:nicotinamidase-related amidase
MKAISQNAALVLIDLQKAIDDLSWGVRNNPQAEQNVGELLDRWRIQESPIVHVRYESREPDSTFRPGQIGSEFKEVAIPEEGELIITKPAASAFIGTNLEIWLRSRSISTVVIVGVITNNSIEATARMAGDLGFRTIVVSDATFTFGRLDYDGRPRTAAEVHSMSLANLDGQYAEVGTTRVVLESRREGRTR